MKPTAKYLFDEDFATGSKPTITVVEAERRREDAEAQAHRKGFALGQAHARGEAAPSMVCMSPPFSRSGRGTLASSSLMRGLQKPDYWLVRAAT